jgi:branched-chain amino acid aminotransferase
MISFINGEYVKFEQCNLHISDLGLQRGYAIFDLFRSVGGEIVWKDDYFDRLFGSLSGSNIGLQLSRNDLNSLCQNLQEKNHFDKSVFKVIITGGYSSDLGTYDGQPNLIIIQKPFKPLPSNYYTEGVNLITEEYQRPDPEIKTMNYFFSLRLHEKMKEFKAVDVLYHTNQIRETARSNFFGIKNGVVHTPSERILKGITRKNLLKLTSLGYIFHERDIFTDELYTFEEVFITGTTKFILPIVQINGKPIGTGKPGKLTKSLMNTFSSISTP